MSQGENQTYLLNCFEKRNVLRLDLNESNLEVTPPPPPPYYALNKHNYNKGFKRRTHCFN